MPARLTDHAERSLLLARAETIEERVSELARLLLSAVLLDPNSEVRRLLSKYIIGPERARLEYSKVWMNANRKVPARVAGNES